MTTLDPAYCADGCGRLAETERLTTGELVCRECLLATHAAWLTDEAVRMVEPHGPKWINRETP